MINWLKYKKIYFTISITLVLISVVSLFLWKLKPGIDFIGGTLVEISSKKEKRVNQDQLNKFFKQVNFEIQSIQESGQNKLVVRSKFISQEKAKEIREKFNKEFKNLELLRFETVGPVLGRELLTKTIMAVILAVLGMLLYIAWAFKNIRFGLAAILALLHDSLILIGTFSLLGKFYGVEVDALFVTAVLTTMSFSVHDTVVVFNKIREKTGKNQESQISLFANEALTETMVRSVNNSLTIIFMLLSLILLGGETVRWFMVALLTGTVLGTYSSPFVAVPLLMIFQKKK